MKKVFKILAVLFVAVITFSLAACGEPEQGGQEGDTLSGTVNIYLPLDAREKAALERVKDDYTRLHRGVTVNIETASDADGYAKTVEGIILAPDETKGDIVQVNVVNQYYGTDKIVDFTSYLSRKNPYGDNKTWRSMLEEDAYRTEDNGYTIPALSYQANSLVAYYNKKVFSENNWNVPTDWASLLSVLDKAKTAGYTYPLGVNFDEKGGAMGNNFKWLLDMYSDQYFRDMISTVHSQESDYSYIEDIDGEWEYSSSSGDVDMRSNYTYNLSRLIDAYFNGSEYNSESVRYADMMRNFYELTRYADPSYTATKTRSAFHNGVLNIYNGSYSRQESCVIYVARMDYAADYQSSIGDVLGYDGGIMSVEALAADLGCFAMPAMTDNVSVEGGAPAADNVRTLGGPDHRPIGIINRGRDKNELAVDFMMYWLSPAGMEAFYSYYSDMGQVCALTGLVKNVIIPSEILLEDMPVFVGDCNLNPYLIFGGGYSAAVFESSTGGTVRDGVAAEMRKYLAGSNADFAATGSAIHNKIVSGFAAYANWKRLKFDSPDKATAYFSVNPIKLSQ